MYAIKLNGNYAGTDYERFNTFEDAVNAESL
jgi:hypothetical protein